VAWVNPTTPNLQDYLSFLYSGAVGVPPANLPSVVGTVTGATATSLTDTAQTWTLNQWNGDTVADITLGEQATVTATTPPGTVAFTPAVVVVPVVGDTYVIAPDVVFTSLKVALEIVSPRLGCASSTIYTLAVYNLAADRLINYAPDVLDQTYFADLRKQFNLLSVSVGVTAQASDQGTSVGMLNQEQMKLFTFQDLQTLKTPMGRQYMAFAQTYGRSLWGLS
jgi:hypothetical protein